MAPKGPPSSHRAFGRPKPDFPSFSRPKPFPPPQALKKYLAVSKHFDDIHEDQFDFHGYCVRKVCVRWSVQCCPCPPPPPHSLPPPPR